VSVAAQITGGLVDVASDDDGEPTLILCLRCTQRFTARDSCPYCSSLRIATVPEDATEPQGPWMFELWEQTSAGAVALITRLGGFGDQADALVHAGEFLKHYIAQARAAGLLGT
jgi:hypothetical protein